VLDHTWQKKGGQKNMLDLEVPFQDCAAKALLLYECMMSVKAESWLLSGNSLLSVS
jgi:hypothetical protein